MSMSPADINEEENHLYGYNTVSHQRKLDMNTRDISTVKTIIDPKEILAIKKFRYFNSFKIHIVTCIIQ